MGIELVIRILGLFGFVPNKDESRSMSVLGVDARAPGIASDGTRYVSHHTYIKFNIEDMDASLPHPFFYIHHASSDEKPKGQWLLINDDLEIRACDSVLPDGGLTILRSGDNRDFSLIPAMRNFYPELQGIEVKKEYLNWASPASAGLTARLRLTRGTISAYPGEAGENISTDEYTLTSSPKRYRQRLAGCAEYNTRLDSDNVTLYSKQLGKGLTFRPADGKRVELVLANIPPDGLAGAMPYNAEKDMDFELIYGIADHPPYQLRVPTRNLIGPEYPSPFLCVGAEFNPSDIA
jgi:hypothetical protein